MMANIIFNIKHWQISIFVIAAITIIPRLVTLEKLMNYYHNDFSFFIFCIIIYLIPFVIYSGWIFLFGFFLTNYLSNDKKIKIFLIINYALIFIFSIAAILLEILTISGEYFKSDLYLTFEKIGSIFFLIFIILVTYVFNKNKIIVRNLFFTFLAIFFYPIGIFFFKKDINKLIKENE